MAVDPELVAAIVDGVTTAIEIVLGIQGQQQTATMAADIKLTLATLNILSQDVHGKFAQEWDDTTQNSSVAMQTAWRIEAALRTLSNALGGGNTDISSLLNQILNAVSNPIIPPTPTEIAGGVWTATDLFSDDEALTYGQEIANAHRWATLMIQAGSVPAKASPFFNVSYPPPSPDSIPTNYTRPTPDWTDIRPDDQLLTWSQRTCPDFTWDDDFTGSRIIGYLTELNEYEAPHYTARLTPAEWKRMYGGQNGLPPIWPGIDHVTLGEPVPITGDTEVVGPMNGCLIALTTVPPGKNFWSAGERSAYKYAGYVTFTSDNGDADTQQYLGFDQAVYCPRTLALAQSCLIHCAAGIEGVATPWTKAA